jgi:hypothetical protein
LWQTQFIINRPRTRGGFWFLEWLEADPLN